MMTHSQHLPATVRNRPYRLVILLLMFMIPLMLGCGSEDPAVSPPDTTADETTTSQPDGTTPTTEGPSTTTPSDPMDVPMAIWVSSGPEADTPESAAEAAVRELLGVTPILGEFQAGDSRSGEMLVFSPGENGLMQRSLLMLRQMGPGEKWSVIAAINPDIGIDAPPAGSLQNAGLLTVSGMARGFEGTIIVSAYRVGADHEVLDMRIAAGGGLWDPEPFSVEMNLNGSATGEVIAIVVRGDTGLDNDTGEFSAIAIRIG